MKSRSVVEVVKMVLIDNLIAGVLGWLGPALGRVMADFE